MSEQEEEGCNHKNTYSYNVYDPDGKLIGTGVACKDCGDGVQGELH